MRSLALALILLLAGCGGMGTGDSNGAFAQAAGDGFAGFLLVDAGTGVVTTRGDVPDLATNPAYRSDIIVFRRIPGGAPVLGTSPFEAYREPDDEQRHGVRAIQEHFLAVFELTDAQFQRLRRAVDPQVPASGTDRPQVGRSAAEVDALVAGYRAHTGLRIRLPRADEWEHACRAGSGGLFSWGDLATDTTANQHAVTALSKASWMAPVGGLQANAFGLHDMHGNVWELTADESDDGSSRVICGGSWRDPVLQGRCANRLHLPALAAHPLVGVRLALDR